MAIQGRLLKGALLMCSLVTVGAPAARAQSTGQPPPLITMTPSSVQQAQHTRTSIPQADCEALKQAHPRLAQALGNQPCLIDITLTLGPAIYVPPTQAGMFLRRSVPTSARTSGQGVLIRSPRLYPMDWYNPQNGFTYTSATVKSCSAYGNLCQLWNDSVTFGFAWNAFNSWIQSGPTCGGNAFGGTLSHDPSYGGWCGYNNNGALNNQPMSVGDNFTTIYGPNVTPVQVDGQTFHWQRAYVDQFGDVSVSGSDHPTCSATYCY